MWLFRLELAVGRIGLDQNILSINAFQVNVPSYNIDPIIVHHLNQDVKMAGRPTLGNMQVSFYTGYNKDAVEQLERWQHLIYRPSSEVLGFAASYKVNGTLVVYAVDNTDWKEYQLLGVWPAVIGDREYEWTASDNVTRTAVFEVDKVLAPSDRNSFGPARSSLFPVA